MSILFKDELYKSETVEILSQYIADAQLSGCHQVTYKQMHYERTLASEPLSFWILK